MTETARDSLPRTPRPGKIYAQMAAIMADVEAIEKDRKNTQGQGYQFRGIDDVFNAMHPLFAKHKVFPTPTVLSQTREERKANSGGVLIYTILTVNFTFYAEDGSCVEATTVGEAFDSGDKSSNKAMSAAMKYAILETFLVPTIEDKDTESASPQVMPRDGGRAPRTDKGPVADGRSTASKETKKVSEAQARRLYGIIKDRMDAGWDPELAEQMAIKAFGVKEAFTELTMAQYDKLVGWVQTLRCEEAYDKLTAWLADKNNATKEKTK
jgi:hypothetical protein